jgi:hypothetical protein
MRKLGTDLSTVATVDGIAEINFSFLFFILGKSVFLASIMYHNIPLHSRGLVYSSIKLLCVNIYHLSRDTTICRHISVPNNRESKSPAVSATEARV